MTRCIRTTITITITTLTSLFSLAACGDTTSGDDTSPTTSTSDAPTTTAPTSSSTTPADSSTTVDTDDSTTTDDGSTETGTADSSTDDGSTDDGSTDDGSTTEATGIEIAGSWTDGFGLHDIDDTTWTQTFGEDSFPYAISQYDNRTQVAIAQDVGTEGWARFDWLWIDEDLYYCQSAFGLESEAEAVAATPGDPTDPATGGCGPFPWSPLTAL